MKTEVYSWRLSADLKSSLEREARRRKISLSTALDLAAQEWLKQSAADEDDTLRQQQLQDAARECFGAIAGGNRRRSETVSQTLRRRLRLKYAR